MKTAAVTQQSVYLAANKKWGTWDESVLRLQSTQEICDLSPFQPCELCNTQQSNSYIYIIYINIYDDLKFFFLLYD